MSISSGSGSGCVSGIVASVSACKARFDARALVAGFGLTCFVVVGSLSAALRPLFFGTGSSAADTSSAVPIHLEGGYCKLSPRDAVVRASSARRTCLIYSFPPSRILIVSSLTHSCSILNFPRDYSYVHIRIKCRSMFRRALCCDIRRLKHASSEPNSLRILLLSCHYKSIL